MGMVNKEEFEKMVNELKGLDSISEIKVESECGLIRIQLITKSSLITDTTILIIFDLIKKYRFLSFYIEPYENNRLIVSMY